MGLRMNGKNLAPAALDELARLAAGAVGSWRSSRTLTMGNHINSEHADFIAAADPATVTALIDEVKRLRGVVERVDVVAKEWQAEADNERANGWTRGATICDDIAEQIRTALGADS